MAEKNIAYMVREDVKTIGVRFYQKIDIGRMITDDELNADLSKKEYTYVTHLDFKVGDLAVVRAAGEVKVVFVSRVDAECEIEPNQDIKYSWVIDRVDTEEYEKQMDINEELEATVNRAYKRNVKEQFRKLVMGSIDSETAAKINMMLGVQPK